MDLESNRVIWWNGFCGNESEYNVFWDDQLTLNTTHPDFSDCFQKSVFTWITCGFLWLSSVFYIPYLYGKKWYVTGCAVSKLNLIKLISAAVLIALQFCDLIWFVTHSPGISVYPVDYLDISIKIVTYFLAAILTNVTYRKAIHSSGVLFFFWFLQLIVAIVRLRSLLLRGVDEENKFTDITYFCSFAFVIISFLACLFPDLLNSVLLEQKSKYSFESKPLMNAFQPDDQECGPPCPQLRATFLSILFFWWFTPTIITGWKRSLTNDDIFRIRKQDSSEVIVPKFEKYWKTDGGDRAHVQPALNGSDTAQDGSPWKKKKLAEKPSAILEDEKFIETKFITPGGDKKAKKTKPSLLLTLTKTFLPYFSLAGVLLLVYCTIAFINPYLLNLLLTYIQTNSPFAWRGYLYAVGMFCTSLVSVVCMHHHFNITYTTGLRVRTALTAAIYRKALTLSQFSRKSVTVGEIVNLMSVDAQKIQDALAFMHYVWSSPYMVVIAVYFLWQILGPSTMAGVGFMLIILPINSAVLANKIRDFQREQMTLKDSRIKLMNQILSGMKILKLYAWEQYFTSKISGIREQELRVLRKTQILSAVTYIMWFCSSFLVALLCFATYVLSSPENILDAQTAFVSMSLIMLLNFPLTILPPAIMFLVQAMVSLRRIEKYLLEDDVDESNVTYNQATDSAVTIQNGTFSWGSDDMADTLQDINLNIGEGKLVAIVGQVGCGKSSLLSAILGEMQKKSGSVNVKGSVAYVSQQAWIQNMSLKSNILFAKQYHQKYYDRILDACALRQDIAILPGGDETEIGERGINLSGGQKQRVSLARAVYQDADIYLLDDTLSAVDAHVGKHIFKEVIGPEGLLKRKTRILVTHGIGFLSKVDEIVVISNNSVSERGSFDELITRNGAFAEFIRTYLKECSAEPEVEEEVKTKIEELQRQVSLLSEDDEDGIKSVHSSIHSLDNLGSRQQLRKRQRSMMSTGSTGKDRSSFADDNKPAASLNVKLIQEEIAEEGAVKLSVLKSYLSSAPVYYSIGVFVSLCLFIAAQCGTNIWLSMWTNDKVVNGTSNRDQTNLRLGVYGALGACQTLSVFGLAASISLGCICASRTLHSTLLNNIVKCPMSFFDTVPLGRIVNRFSKDIDILDSNIPQFSQNLMTTFAPLVSTIIIICYSTPIFVAVIVPLMIFFGLLQRVYVACARQIKRIDSIRRSPLYAFFNETLTGTSTIRAYKQQQRFINHSDQLLDNSQRVWFESFSSNRWIGIWAEFIGDLIIFFTALFSVMQKDSLNPGVIGLSLSFALQVNMCIIMTVRSSCELETYIVAVERIKEYTELENEAPWVIDDNRPPRNWPADGAIEFKDYSTRYREGLELVLKGISCKVEPGEKVGIVGRTGAGKSSMTLALFRLIEPSGGVIEIDGTDIGRLGLHDVRRKLTVIPQDPVLFSGSLRFNLDPSENFTDSEVWLALEQAHLKDFVLSLPNKLEHEAGEDGSNLSVGQRQLLCLARALLRKSKILVLDEATAAIDLETDDLIQSTIRSEFKNCTVLTIAHRLNTIMDYDRIMVLQEGEIREFASPNKLLEDEQTIFYSLARDAGLIIIII